MDEDTQHGIYKKSDSYSLTLNFNYTYVNNSSLILIYLPEDVKMIRLFGKLQS